MWKLIVRQNYTDIVFEFSNQEEALNFIGVFVNSVTEPVTFSLKKERSE